MHQVLTQEQVDFYFINGYLHVKDVYEPSVIDQIRDIFGKSLEDGKWEEAPYYNEGITTNIYSLFPELIPLVFNDKYIQILHDLFGKDCVTLPEPAIHRNRYYYWHKDSTFLDEQRETFHWNDDFQAIMSAMYFQENHPEYGGGITVIPKTQNKPDQFWKANKANIVQRAFLRLQKKLGISFFDRMENHKEKYFIPSEKGDLVILNLKIDHKGTTPSKVSPYEKFAIFNIVCSDEKYVDQINTCLRRRPSGYYRQYLVHEKEIPQALQEHLKEKELKISF